MSAIPITVLMPVHNAERYVLGAVESVLGQSWQEFEFLIVNDGSTDASRDLLAGVKDERLRIVDTERAGIAGALALGLQLARGRYVARMDADDESLPDRLARQKACLDERPDVGMVHCRAECIDGDGRPLGRIRGDLRTDLETKWLLVWHNVPVHPTVMLRADVSRRHGLTYRPGFDRAEDFDLWSRLSLVAGIHLIPEVLLRYRIHAASVTQGAAPEPLSRVYARVIFESFERYGVAISEEVAAELAVIGGGTWVNPITYRYRHLREILEPLHDAVSRRFCERFRVGPNELAAVQAEQLTRWARYMLGTSRSSAARLLWTGLRRHPPILGTYLLWAVAAALVAPAGLRRRIDARQIAGAAPLGPSANAAVDPPPSDVEDGSQASARGATGREAEDARPNGRKAGRGCA
jgi:glycosyltransferase involved in cell wall biosynthesis